MENVGALGSSRWLTVLCTDASFDEERLELQLEALRNTPGVGRIGLLLTGADSGAGIGRRFRKAYFDFALNGDPASRHTRARIRSRLAAGEEHVLLHLGSHVLERRTLGGFMAYHEREGNPESAFTPGADASVRTRPIALAWTAATLERGIQLQDWVMFPLRARARRLPDPVLRRLRPLVRRARARWARRNGRAGHGAATASGPATRQKLPIFLGTIDDQVELLADRAGEFYPFPSVVNLVLTNLCNLKCVMCPYHSPLYPDLSGFFAAKKYMSDEIFERVATEAGTYGSSLKLGQLEEVLIHPRLIPWVEQARTLGVRNVHITTNGTLLTRKRADALVQAGLSRIYVSLDAATAETYKKIRGFNFRKVLGHIDGLFEARARYNPEMKIYTSMILQKDAIHEHDQFIEIWRSRGADGVIVYQLSEHYDAHNTIADFYFDPTPPETRHACSSVWEETYVYPEGEVSTCCYTMILTPQRGLFTVGNVRERPLSEIWLGQQYRSLRERLLRNDIPQGDVCETCNIWHANESQVVQRNGYKVLMNPVCAIHEFK